MRTKRASSHATFLRYSLLARLSRNCNGVLAFNGHSHEAHNHRLHCDCRRWARSLWGDSLADRFPNPRAECQSDSSAVTHRYAHCDTYLNAVTFGQPVVDPERLTEPDRGPLWLRALRDRRRRHDQM